jgi:uncharacterized protein
MRSRLTLAIAVALHSGLALTAPLPAHEHPVDPELTVPPGLLVPYFYEYDPPSTLVVPAHPTPRAKYPFVDVHNHQGRMADYGAAEWEELLAAMDGMNMAVMVNLSGRGFRRVAQPDGTTRFGMGDTESLGRAVAGAAAAAPGRFVVFTNVDFDGFGEPGWSARAVAALEADVAAGARGLKIYKGLGMGTTDSAGARVPVDDPRLDPIWARCGELGVPVLIHSADPAPFWEPRTKDNERLLELMERPGRYRDPAEHPPFDQILAEQHEVFRKHPRRPSSTPTWAGWATTSAVSASSSTSCPTSTPRSAPSWPSSAASRGPHGSS